MLALPGKIASKNRVTSRSRYSGEFPTNFPDAHTLLGVHSPECCFSDGGCAVAVGSGDVRTPADPEIPQRLGIAQAVRAELQQGLGVVLSPELFRSFHAGIDLLDRRLDMAARQRQALAAIGGVVHPPLMVRIIRQRPVDALPGIGVTGVLVREAQTFLVRRQFANHLADIALPDPLGKAAVGLLVLQNRRGAVGVRERVHQINDGRHLAEVFFVDRPDRRRAVRHDRRAPARGPLRLRTFPLRPQWQQSGLPIARDLAGPAWDRLFGGRHAAAG